MLIELNQHTASITKPAEQYQRVIGARTHEIVRVIDERGGGRIARDPERRALRREKERFGVGSRRFEPTRIFT